MNDPKHVPPPYSVDAVMSDYDLDICLAYDVPSEGSPIVIASVYGDEEDDDRLMNVKKGKATAKFIVRACNLHDELVDALRGLLMVSLPGDISGQRHIDYAREVLAKTKGGSA